MYEKVVEILEGLERSEKPIWMQTVPDNFETEDRNEAIQFLNGEHENVRTAYARVAGSVGCYDWWRDDFVKRCRAVADITKTQVVMTMFPGRALNFDGTADDVIEERIESYRFGPGDKRSMADQYIVNFENVRNADIDHEMTRRVDSFAQRITGSLRLSKPGCVVIWYNEGAQLSHYRYSRLLPYGGYYGDGDSFGFYPMEVQPWKEFAEQSTRRRPAWAWVWLEAGFEFANYWTAEKRYDHGGIVQFDKTWHAQQFHRNVGMLIGSTDAITGVIIHRPKMWSETTAINFRALVQGIADGVTNGAADPIPSPEPRVDLGPKSRRVLLTAK